MKASLRGIGDVVDIRSVDAAPCPASIRHWSYRRGQHWSKTGSVTVKCSQNWNKIKCDISSTSLAQQKFVIYKCHNTNSTEVACKGPGPGPGPGSGPTYSGSFLSAVFVMLPSARLLACTGRNCVLLSRGVGGCGGGGGRRCHCTVKEFGGSW